MSLPTTGWHYRRSLASRVTLLTTIAVGLSIAGIAVGVYVVMRMQLQATMDESLLARARSAANDADAIVIDYRTNRQLPSWALNAGGVQIGEVYGEQGWWMASQDASRFPRPGAPEIAVAQGQVTTSVRTVSTTTTTFRVVAVPIPGQNNALVLAQSLEPQEHMYKRLGLVMLLFGAAGVIAAGVAGWGVASGGLRPVRRLTASVRNRARTEDLTPLPVEGDDEIASLASSFNTMLAALTASRDRQRQLVADASHELRTPLTSLRTNIELLTQADASITGDQRAELLGDIRAQIEELTTLIGDLVELARDEPPAPVVEAVDLDDVVDQALARVRLRAPTVTWEVEATPWWVLGEAGGLERAVTNLFDNAAKWSPEHGTVRVSLDHGVLTVDDEGPGIAESDLPHVFDRFYRSAESRGMPGSGLGLAIVRQVVERTGGSVEAGRTPAGGARLVVRLPGSPHPMPRTAPTGQPAGAHR
ncbi:HAMP domain-containing sensor histidine kinase [Nocardioides sp. KR10-350]|uniref:HAMP domain-containing sensor histidine kinase n=1 Tax=Nocardioides cheoyonin TaxID=3156615 RepID=UPI0032B34229